MIYRSVLRAAAPVALTAVAFALRCSQSKPLTTADPVAGLCRQPGSPGGSTDLRFGLVSTGADGWLIGAWTGAAGVGPVRYQRNEGRVDGAAVVLGVSHQR